MSEFGELEQEAARLLSRSVEDAAGWLGTAEAQLRSSYGSQISAWQQALQFEYGCWCGPGSRCQEDKDAMDSCCHKHDEAYDSLGLDFGSMWSATAIVKAQAADKALYDCVNGTPEPDDPEARTYRQVLLDAFSTRVAIAGWLKDL